MNAKKHSTSNLLMYNFVYFYRRIYVLYICRHKEITHWYWGKAGRNLLGLITRVHAAAHATRLMGWPLGTHAEYGANIGYVILIRLSTLSTLIQINDMYIKGFGIAQRHASTTSGQRQFHREGRRVINICPACLRLCFCCYCCCCSWCRRRNWRHLFGCGCGSCSCSRRDQFAGAQWQLACASINSSWWRTGLAWQLQLGRSVRTGPFIVGCHGTTGHRL